MANHKSKLTLTIEVRVLDLIRQHGEIRNAHLTEGGMDISVARRVLAHLVDSGHIQSRKDYNGVLWFKQSPETMLDKPWRTRRIPEEGQHTPRYY